MSVSTKQRRQVTVDLLRVYEISVKVFTLRDFQQEEASFVISGFVDVCLSKDIKYLEFHNKNCYKGYVIDMPYPLEPGGTYKKEKVYTVRIRMIHKELMNYLMENLGNTTSEYFKGLTTHVRVIPKKHISKIYSITPVLMKLGEGGYWKSNISFEQYEHLLKTNLIKKYNTFMNTKIDEGFQFYTNIRKLNRVPIKIKFKNIALLGDKFEIEVADNEMAQELAYLALAAGIGENNSRGCGFVNYKYL